MWRWIAALRAAKFASEKKDAPVPAGGELTVLSGPFDEVRVAISGRIDIDNASRVYDELTWLIRSEPLRNVAVDVGELEYLDAAGAAVLSEAKALCALRNNSFRIINVSDRFKVVAAAVEDFEPLSRRILDPRPLPGLMEQLGAGAIKFVHTVKDILTFIGAAAVAFSQDLFQFRGRRWEGFFRLVERAGCDAVPLVAALSFLMGSVMAFQAAIQLRKFGANVFVADLVSLSICLEMGPLMTALIVAGRSGAAYAAEIGTMQVTEEVDALRVMGIDPVKYLVSPRILALAFVLPCLTLFADLLGVIGGGVVAFLSLDLTPTTYISQMRKVLELSDVVKGLIKSFSFGFEVALIGCLRGFQVKGGAESVGAAATSAVVTSIFIIVVTDAVFSVMYHYVRFI